jgi:AraC-like DNA-binding protein
MNTLSAPSPADPEPLAMDTMLHKKYDGLIRQHLDALLPLFKELTGLDSGVAWAPSWPRRWTAPDLPTPSRLCRQVAAESAALQARCRRCGSRHLGLALHSAHEGLHFTCPRRMRNFWFPIIVRHSPVGIAFVQALAAESRGQAVSPCRQDSTLPAGSCSGASHLTGVNRASRRQFERAAKLLRLIFEQVQTLALADLRREDLTDTQRALGVFANVQARLREDLNGLMAVFRKRPPTLQPVSRAQQLVQAVLEHIQRDYAQPLTLQRCAADLRVNAAYLSHLFAQTVGLPFKTVLSEGRVERARALLSDPARCISDVAAAVGYASRNRFRLAFKKVTSLPPRVWRATLQMGPPKPVR